MLTWRKHIRSPSWPWDEWPSKPVPAAHYHLNGPRRRLGQFIWCWNANRDQRRELTVAYIYSSRSWIGVLGGRGGAYHLCVFVRWASFVGEKSTLSIYSAGCSWVDSSLTIVAWYNSQERRIHGYNKSCTIPVNTQRLNWNRPPGSPGCHNNNRLV